MEKDVVGTRCGKNVANIKQLVWEYTGSNNKTKRSGFRNPEIKEFIISKKRLWKKYESN